MNTFEDNKKYFNSEEYKNWVELTNDKPKQVAIGYWVCYYENKNLKWEFKKN